MEDFTNYKKPSMYIAFPSCTFKCEGECGQKICQNSKQNWLFYSDVDNELRKKISHEKS